MSINVLVVDDHEVVRQGLGTLLSDADIQVVAEATDGNEAMTKVKQHRPDVVLMDIRMPERDGLSALDAICRENPDTKVVMLSTYDNPTYIARSVAHGAQDYVLKGSGRDTLISAIENAARGADRAPESEMNSVAGRMNATKRDEDTPLTNRESQVLRHVALGLSNKEIGKSLQISVETVKEHVQNILRKINVSDRTQAAVWAVRRGLV